MTPIELDLYRDTFYAKRTLGVLSYNGQSFGYVCEDPDRGLTAGMTPERLAALKVRGETCIAAGRWPIVLEYSPKYGPDTLTIIVPGHRLIRVHPGTNEDDTKGCICPGMARNEWGVQRSKVAVEWLRSRLVPHLASGGKAWLNIHREPVAWSAAPFNPETK